MNCSLNRGWRFSYTPTGPIFQAVENVHETLHREGTIRLMTSIKVGTRSDKTPTLASKLF
jgi:uncharacterized protein YqgV (UPF0045/DUF77 family)